MRYIRLGFDHPAKKIILGLVSILIVGLCLLFFVGKLFFTRVFLQDYLSCNAPNEKCNFTDRTPEEVFLKYVWWTIPPEVTQIEGVEGLVPFSEGPAYMRFKADKSFIRKLITTANNYGTYSPASSCTFFDNISSHKLIQDFPEKFKWWNPSEVDSPVCFSAQGTQGDDFKYILVDFDMGIVYFYRNATCGLCPD